MNYKKWHTHLALLFMALVGLSGCSSIWEDESKEVPSLTGNEYFSFENTEYVGYLENTEKRDRDVSDTGVAIVSKNGCVITNKLHYKEVLYPIDEFKSGAFGSIKQRFAIYNLKNYTHDSLEFLYDLIQEKVTKTFLTPNAEFLNLPKSTTRPFPNLFIVDLDNLTGSTYLVRNNTIEEMQAPILLAGTSAGVHKGEFWPVSEDKQCRISSYDFYDSTKTDLAFLNCLDSKGEYSSATLNEPAIIDHPRLFTDLSWIDADGSRIDWNDRIWDVRFTDGDKGVQLVSMSMNADDFRAYEENRLPSWVEPTSMYLGVMGVSRGSDAFVWLSVWEPQNNEWGAKDLVKKIVLYRVKSDFLLSMVKEYNAEGVDLKWHSWIVDDNRIALVLGEALYLFDFDGRILGR